jgi:ankyrin repeat protein
MQKKCILLIVVNILFSGSFLQALHHLPLSFFKICIKISTDSFVDYAVKNDDDKLFAQLLAAGLPIYANDNALLKRIASQRKKNIFKGLVASKYFIDQPGKASVLCTAAASGSIAMVKTCLGNSKESINWRDSTGNTALHYTAAKGLRRVARLLLNKGAELEVKNDNDETPLLYAAKCNKVCMMKFLIQSGANNTVRDKEKRTPLLVGAFYNKTCVVDYEMQNGHSPFEIDGQEMTALMYAADRNNCKMIKIVALHGTHALLKKKNKYGFTALDIARFSQNFQAEALLSDLQDKPKYYDMVDREANQKIHDFFNKTQKYSGCSKKNINQVSLLMQREIFGKKLHN